ncbi:MAG: DUF1858 domain-containing protein [Candidatus Neomarinimicrobiota bacterium]
MTDSVNRAMIDKDIYIEDLVREYPHLIRPLAENNLVCIACGEPLWGTLAELAEAKGVANLDKIIRELNRITANLKD